MGDWFEDFELRRLEPRRTRRTTEFFGSLMSWRNGRIALRYLWIKTAGALSKRVSSGSGSFDPVSL